MLGTRLRTAGLPSGLRGTLECNDSRYRHVSSSDFRTPKPSATGRPVHLPGPLGERHIQGSPPSGRAGAAAGSASPTPMPEYHLLLTITRLRPVPDLAEA